MGQVLHRGATTTMRVRQQRSAVGDLEVRQSPSAMVAGAGHILHPEPLST